MRDQAYLERLLARLFLVCLSVGLRFIILKGKPTLYACWLESSLLPS